MNRVTKINIATMAHREQKWQSRVFCLTKPSAKSIFLALHLTAGWPTGRQRDTTAVWKYTDVAGFSVADLLCVCACVCVCACAHASFHASWIVINNKHAKYVLECLFATHVQTLREILLLSVQQVCLHECSLYWLCMHMSPSCVLVLLCVQVCVCFRSTVGMGTL